MQRASNGSIIFGPAPGPAPLPTYGSFSGTGALRTSSLNRQNQEEMHGEGSVIEGESAMVEPNVPQNLAATLIQNFTFGGHLTEKHEISPQVTLYQGNGFLEVPRDSASAPFGRDIRIPCTLSRKKMTAYNKDTGETEIAYKTFLLAKSVDQKINRIITVENKNLDTYKAVRTPLTLNTPLTSNDVKHYYGEVSMSTIDLISTTSRIPDVNSRYTSTTTSYAKISEFLVPFDVSEFNAGTTLNPNVRYREDIDVSKLPFDVSSAQLDVPFL